MSSDPDDPNDDPDYRPCPGGCGWDVSLCGCGDTDD